MAGTPCSAVLMIASLRGKFVYAQDVGQDYYLFREDRHIRTSSPSLRRFAWRESRWTFAHTIKNPTRLLDHQAGEQAQRVLICFPLIMLVLLRRDRRQSITNNRRELLRSKAMLIFTTVSFI